MRSIRECFKGMNNNDNELEVEITSDRVEMAGIRTRARRYAARNESIGHVNDP